MSRQMGPVTRCIRQQGNQEHKEEHQVTTLSILVPLQNLPSQNQVKRRDSWENNAEPIGWEFLHFYTKGKALI